MLSLDLVRFISNMINLIRRDVLFRKLYALFRAVFFSILCGKQ